MKTWRPWTITDGTLQLAEWPDHEQGAVVVEVDVFAAQEVTVVDLEGDIVCHTLPPGVGSHDTDPWDYDDVLRDLFRHIDAHPATHYVLRTLRPERVREAWCHGGIPYLGPMDRSPEETATEWANRLVRTQLRRPNVTLGTGPIRTQEDADRLCPLALGLADLCSGLELWLQPVERIDFGLVDDFVEVVNQGSYSRISDTWLGFQYTFPVDRITVTGGEQPLHPDNVRCLRDQAVDAGVAFAFLGWGEWVPEDIHLPGYDWTMVNVEPMSFARRYQESVDYYAVRVGSENSGNTLDGRTWPWELNAPATPGEG